MFYWTHTSELHLQLARAVGVPLLNAECHYCANPQCWKCNISRNTKTRIGKGNWMSSRSITWPPTSRRRTGVITALSNAVGWQRTCFVETRQRV